MRLMISWLGRLMGRDEKAVEPSIYLKGAAGYHIDVFDDVVLPKLFYLQSLDPFQHQRVFFARCGPEKYGSGHIVNGNAGHQPIVEVRNVGCHD